MTEQIRILGWLDPDMPARWKEGAPCEFRLRLSAAPSSSWKKAFGEHGAKQNAEGLELIDKDHLVVSCDLNEIEHVVARLKEQIEQTNQAIDQQDREQAQRAAVHKQAEDERRQQILAAVSKIRFDDVPPSRRD